VASFRDCNLYYDSKVGNYLIEYKGNFDEQIKKLDYACGQIVTEIIAIVAVAEKDIRRLLRDVPSIRYIDFRNMYVLQDISPSFVNTINVIKNNPYINLTGKGVLIGLLDTGIDYLNEEFIREDGTSRIISIWDQSIRSDTNEELYMGTLYSNEQINAAINASKNKQDPYLVVPSKDERGHGTSLAGIIGARGYSSDFQGIAHDSDFVVVKLFESTNFKETLKENGVKDTPVYNASEIVSAVDHLRKTSLILRRPMVICLSIGSTEGSHSGGSLISRYIASIGSVRGICIVAGGGNEGASQGHASGFIKGVGDMQVVELKIPTEMKRFSFYIWVRKPNRISINVISPTGETSQLVESKKDKVQVFNFLFVRTVMTVKYHTPEYFTGNENIEVIFNNIKPGIWTFQLIGVYVTSGRFDIWLPPKDTLPEDTIFLSADPFNTLTTPSMANNVVTAAYVGEDGSFISSSGRGFDLSSNVNPNIAAVGENLLTTKPLGGITTMSGASAAVGVIAGACALLLEWGVVNGNDPTMYSKKIISYLMYGAKRNELYKYPSREVGYGELDLLGTFNVISRGYRTDKIKAEFQIVSDKKEEFLPQEDKFIKYTIGSVFVRIPRDKLKNINYLAVKST